MNNGRFSDPARHRLKVVRLTPVLDYGGVETKIRFQAEQADRTRVDYRVCTFWRDGFVASALRQAGIAVDVLDVDPKIGNPTAVRKLVAYLQHVRPDVVHASIVEANVQLALARVAERVPVAIAEEVGVPQRRLPLRLLLGFGYRMLDCVVAVSEATRDYLVAREHVPMARVRLIPDAILPEYFSPLPTARPGRVRRIVSVGRLVEVKNHETLVRAFGRIVPDFPDARLEVVGEGPLRERLEALVRELGLAEHVSLPGFTGDVLAVLDAADAFALPSLSEGFGIALVEAMARGLPVLGSRAGAIPAIAGELGQAWLVPAMDVSAWEHALRRLLTLDAAEYEQLGRQARRIAERYSPERNVASVLALYEELYARKSR